MNKELNTVENNMLRALTNHKEENFELCWKRGKSKNKTYVLIGRKKTNNMNGEAKYSFETKSLPLGADITSLLLPRKEEPEKDEEAIALSAAKKFLEKKLGKIDEQIGKLQGQKDALYIVLKNNF